MSVNWNASSTKEIAQRAAQSNKDHQYALKVYTERLEAELETVDKLLAAIEEEASDEDPEMDAGGSVVVPGSVKAVGPVSPGDLLSEDSPFYEDATRRQRYLDHTVIHPMKTNELEALSEAVRAENYRMHALEAQQRGEQPFVEIDGSAPGYFVQNTDGIDWERVAQKVSSSSNSHIQRTAQECRVRWMGERHPQFNTSPWSLEEIALVKRLTVDATEGQIDWNDIAVKLGTKRTPIDCMRHAIVRRAHVWSPEADKRLLNAVEMYGIDNWSIVARLVSEDATAAQCQNRYMRSLDPALKRGQWSPQEDAMLRRAAEAFPGSWVDIATFVASRSNEQCRDRWQESVNPTLAKGRWTVDEDAALLATVATVGINKWQEVSETLNNGRTDSMCRTRYNALTRRKNKANAISQSPSTSQPHTPLTSQFELEGFATASTPTSAPVIRPRPQPRPRKRPLPLGEFPEAGPSAMPTTTDAEPIALPRPIPKPRRKSQNAVPEPEAEASGSTSLCAPTNTRDEGAEGAPTVSGDMGQDSVRAVTLTEPTRQRDGKSTQRTETPEPGGTEPPPSKRRRTDAPANMPEAEIQVEGNPVPQKVASSGETVGQAGLPTHEGEPRDILMSETGPETRQADGTTLGEEPNEPGSTPIKPRAKRGRPRKVVTLTTDSHPVDNQTAMSGAEPTSSTQKRRPKNTTAVEPTRRQPGRNAKKAYHP